MSTHIPPQVLVLLRNNNLMHLATSKDNVPSASLMNFTLLPAEETWQSGNEPLIVMATPKDTQKYVNIQANPNVSLLVHDWVSGKGSNEPEGLASYLQRLNQVALSQRSATLQGKARIVTGDEADFYRAVHRKRHPDAECFISGAEMFVVAVTSVRLADSTNHVETFN